MKKKTKIIISLVLTVALIFGSLAGYFALTYQAKAVTNDLSGNNGNAESNNENNAGGGGEDPIAVLSSSVKVFAGDEARDINASIESVVSTENGVEIVFENGVSDKIKSLGVGDIFYLEGN